MLPELLPVVIFSTLVKQVVLSKQGSKNIFVIAKKKKAFFVSNFRKSGHDTEFITIQHIDHVSYDANATSSFKSKARFIAERKWIKKNSNTVSLGLNQSGNISKDPSIDLFSVYSTRTRKSRSHEPR